MRAIAVLSLIALSSCSSLGLGAKSAKADLIDNSNRVVGNATLTETDSGVRIVLDVHGAPPGTHALHIHNNGQCHAGEAKPFDSAGPHFNPYGRKHGLENPDGPHAGDLPNFEVKPDGSKDLGGLTIGLKAPFSEMAKGHPFKADDKVTGNTNKNAMNDRLKAWGYNRYENANPTTDGDHVMEKQLGGPDEVPNVWPLNSSVNQASGSKIRGEIKRIKTQYKINSLKNKWLRPT